MLFRHEGTLLARQLRAEREEVIEALKADGVFALDTAMRIARGYGFLASREVHVYLTSAEPVDLLAEAGLIGATPCLDTVLLRPWRGPTRLFASIVKELPPWQTVKDGYRVVTWDRLAQELIGAVGVRADLFALLERAQKE